MKKIVRLLSCLIILSHLFTMTAFAAEQVFFYHTDPAGTPLAMTDESGDVVWRADYKPFGEEQDVTPYPENNKMFVGKEKDKETGLHYFGARYMKSEIGRFISPDPVGAVDPWTSKTNYSLLTNPQRLNQYAYGLNNPYKYFDPDGEAAIYIKGYQQVRQQIVSQYLGWAPSWLQEIIYPSEPSLDIGPMAIGSGGRRVTLKGIESIISKLNKPTQTSIIRFLKKAPKNITNIKTEKIGKFYKVSYEVPGKAGGQSRAIYTKFIGESGKTIKVYKDSFDRQGRFLNRKIKFPMDKLDE